MAVERIGIEAALASLRQTYPYACPNEGLACTRTIPSATERAAPIQHLVKQGVLVTLSNNKPSQGSAHVQASCNSYSFGMKCDMSSSLTIQATPQS